MKELLSPFVVTAAAGALFACYRYSRNRIFVLSHKRALSLVQRQGLFIFSCIIGGVQAVLFGAGFALMMWALSAAAWHLVLAGSLGYFGAWMTSSLQTYYRFKHTTDERA